MEDLRLLAIEQDFVVLEGVNGEKFRLALDEAVRKALRNDRGPRVESDSISPREIQELVRSGHSVEEIVASTGAPFVFVEKFAVPVLEELEHVVSSAQSVRLSFIGDRYGETNHIEFGVLIRERLAQLGANGVAWRARRNETGGWQVSCEFNLDGAASAAKWSFDLRHLSLSPDNEVALNLAANPKGDALVPKVKPVVVVQEPAVAPATDISHSSADAPLVGKNLTVSLGDTQEFADVIPFGRGRNGTAQVPVIAAGTSAVSEADGNAGGVVDEIDEIGESEDLLDGLRRRRDQREAKTGFTPILEVVRSDSAADDDSDFDEATVWIESGDEVFVDEEDLNQDAVDYSQPLSGETEAAETPAVSPATTESSAPTAKRGRASMPSWDQIVFGTKPDTKED